MLPLTAGIITLNEEANIAACISNLHFCSEILVVDAESHDRTAQIAAEQGARVLQRKWTGFADQRNYLMEMASHPWIFFLDADERVPPESAEHIYKLLRAPQSVAYRFPRKTFYLGRWIQHGGWYPDYQTRLLLKGKNRFANNLVHEFVQTQGKTETLSQPLLHYPFHSIADQMETNNRYSSLLANALKTRNETFSFWKLLTKPWVKFTECYFVKKGFLDGLPGFIIAVGAAYSVFMKWSKLWENQKANP